MIVLQTSYFCYLYWCTKLCSINIIENEPVNYYMLRNCKQCDGLNLKDRCGHPCVPSSMTVSRTLFI